MNRRTIVYLIVAIAATVAIAIPAASVARSGGSSGKKTASLAVNPADFSANITNPLFPLSLVDAKTFQGSETDPVTGEVITIEVTSALTGGTNTVAGVETLVLEETAYENGELVERALDYFAQHTDGTVYYFGEDVENYVNGVVDNTDGTWHAGENGAEPGIVMPAAPFVGQTINQENAPGVAEDMAEFLSIDESITVTAGSFSGCARTLDWNPLDAPDIVYEQKVYCPGVGQVFEEAVDGSASMELISFSAPGAPGIPTGEPSPSPAPPEPGTPDGTPIPGPEDADDVEDEDANEDDDGEDEDGAPGQLTEGEELLPLAGISVADAVQAAQDFAAANGITGDLGEVELEDEDGTLVFEVEIGDEEIAVDAQTGDVIPDDEGADADTAEPGDDAEDTD